MITVLRREEKHLLTLREALHWEHVFSQVMMTDQYSARGSYAVRSLYFDTVDDKDFFDKMTEQNCRRKIRLRIYSSDQTTAKLELKQKENIYQKKRTLNISREDATALINGRFSVLLGYRTPFADELYSIMTQECYRPKTIIEYQRRAFMAKENNIRLTFDREIRATECCFDLYAKTLPLYPVFHSGNTIFEVKYDKFMLGYISELIGGVNKRAISSSKYCLGRSLGYPNQ